MAACGGSGRKAEGSSLKLGSGRKAKGPRSQPDTGRKTEAANSQPGLGRQAEAACGGQSAWESLPAHSTDQGARQRVPALGARERLPAGLWAQVRGSPLTTWIKAQESALELAETAALTSPGPRGSHLPFLRPRRGSADWA